MPTLTPRIVAKSFRDPQAVEFHREEPLQPLEIPPPATSRLFSPFPLNGITVENRVWLPAMVTWLSNDDGIVTPAIEARYLRYARGGVGMIVMEAMGIRDIKSGPLMRIGHDRYVPPLRDLVHKIHQSSSSKVIPQIIDFLKIGVRDPLRALRRLKARYPDHPELEHYSDEQLQALLTPREFCDYQYGYRQLIDDLDVTELEKIVTYFAQAARRARAAGFDGVELHFAHAYTMASFLSRRNRRLDGYGGEALENRVRFPLEVIRGVRSEVGTDFLVGLRFLGSEDIDGGSTLGDAVWFALEFARAGIDFISVSRGGKFEDARQPKIGEAMYPYTGNSGTMCMPTYVYEAAYNLHLPAQIRRYLREHGFLTPVVAAGRINTYELAETISQYDRADLIGMARGLLADPDWPNKAARGAFDAIHYCRYNNVCEALDRKHQPVRCQLWMKEDGGSMQAPIHW